MKKSPYNIIKTVLVTEKSTDLTEAENKYCFKVAKIANKIEIKNAIEKLFSVEVASVNTMNYIGKLKRMRGKLPGRRPSWKKAVVELKEGSTIDLF